MKTINPWFPIPLIHDGDSYIITCIPVGEQVKLEQVIRYRNNQNVEGEELTFYDLDYGARKAVVRQVRRRHPGCTIIV